MRWGRRPNFCLCALGDVQHFQSDESMLLLVKDVMPLVGSAEETG